MMTADYHMQDPVPNQGEQLVSEERNLKRNELNLLHIQLEYPNLIAGQQDPRTP